MDSTFSAQQPQQARHIQSNSILGEVCAEQPAPDPLGHFAASWDRADRALEELEHVVTVLLEGNVPTGASGKEVAGHTLDSVQQLVRQFPGELGQMSERISIVSQRLRDAFLRP